MSRKSSILFPQVNNQYLINLLLNKVLKVLALNLCTVPILITNYSFLINILVSS